MESGRSSAFGPNPKLLYRKSVRLPYTELNTLSRKVDDDGDLQRRRLLLLWYSKTSKLGGSSNVFDAEYAVFQLGLLYAEYKLLLVITRCHHDVDLDVSDGRLLPSHFPCLDSPY